MRAVLFSLEKFNLITNNSAKLQAPLSETWLCKDLSYNNICIDSNLNLVVGWIQSKLCPIWYLWDFWEELEVELKDIHYSVIHKFKEGN